MPGVQFCGQRREPLRKHSNVISKRLEENLSVAAVLREAGAKFSMQRPFERIEAGAKLTAQRPF